LWAGEEVTSDGRVPFARARISPVPPEPVRVWIGASAPPAIERAARLGDGWIASPNLTPEEARLQLDAYREACGVAGRPAGTTVIRRDLYVGESDDDARRRGSPVIDAGYRGFPPEATILGSASTVAERLAALADIGFDEVLVRNLMPDAAAALDSTERLAEVKRLLDS
jgi:alkanesulfonate monooxygenase SsuD/methylene tetrahydromethanopterin reductase-like flavin-dependent oxidoreductase (luciferase family)